MVEAIKMHEYEYEIKKSTTIDLETLQKTRNSSKIILKLHDF